jgi:hypothetical protein
MNGDLAWLRAARNWLIAAGRSSFRSIAASWSMLVQNAQVLAALATIGLAIVTLVLVFVTREVAGQTRAAVRTSVLPILSDVPTGAGPGTIVYDRAGDEAVYGKLRDLAALDVRTFPNIGKFLAIAARSVAVRNIGNGPAVVQEVRLRAPYPHPGLASCGSRSTPGVSPARSLPASRLV